MTTINLKDFYYWYLTDELVEVPDEVADVHFDGDVAGLTTIHLAAHNALGVLDRDAALCVRQDDDEDHSDQSQDNQQRQHDVEERLTVLGAGQNV